MDTVKVSSEIKHTARIYCQEMNVSIGIYWLAPRQQCTHQGYALGMMSGEFRLK